MSRKRQEHSKNETQKTATSSDQHCSRCESPLNLQPNSDISKETAANLLAFCDPCWWWFLGIMVGPDLHSIIHAAMQNRKINIRGIQDQLQKQAKESLDLFTVAAKRSEDSPRKSAVPSMPSAVRRWESHWRQVREAKKDYDNAVPMKYGPSGEFAILVSAAISQQRFWRRYLIKRFRFDPLRRKWLRGAKLEISKMTALELALYDYSDRRYYTFEAGFRDGLGMIFNLLKEGKDVQANIAEVAEVIRQTLQNFEVEAADRRIDSRLSPLAEEALTKIGGWMKTHINTDKNKRIRSAYFVEADSRLQTFNEWLLNQLPPAILIARSERQPKEPLAPGSGSTSLFSRAMNELSRERLQAGSRSDEVEQLISDQQIDPADPSSTDFARQLETADELAAWYQRAGLTPAEQEIVDLKAQGHIYQEIADKTGRAVGTVKTLASRALQKLQRSR